MHLLHDFNVAATFHDKLIQKFNFDGRWRSAI